jgi:hypothetical protein
MVLCYSCNKDENLLLNNSNYKITEIITEDTNFVIDKPWEKEGIGYINVIKEESTWHLWYESFYSSSTDHPDNSGALCYAYSEDGVNWIKPELDLYTFYGEKSNIIYKSNIPKKGLHGVGVSRFINEPYKYRMAYNKLTGESSEYPTKVYMMESVDGFNWENEKLILDHPSDTQNILLNFNGENYLFFRKWSGGIHAKGKRTIGVVRDTKLNFNIDSIKTVQINGGAVPSNNGEYYNSSVKIIDERLFFFPTVFYPSEDKSKIEIAEGEFNEEYVSIKNNDTSLNMKNNDFNLLAPQIIPVEGVGNQYYVYLYNRIGGHNIASDESFIYKIKRIKISIESL